MRPSLLCLAIILTACGPSTESAKKTAGQSLEVLDAEHPFPAPLQTSLERYSASHIVIGWSASLLPPKGIDRTQQEALKLAKDLHKRARRQENFQTLAKTYSDGPSRSRGGELGVFLVGTMVPIFEAAVASVAIGDIAPVTRTPFGYHIIQRDGIVQMRISHILIPFEGNWGSNTERTRNTAKERIEQALERLNKKEPFTDLVAEYSEDVSAGQHGDLGWITPGQMIPDFEEAAFRLDKGEHTFVVETAYGFHIILRTE